MMKIHNYLFKGVRFFIIQFCLCLLLVCLFGFCRIMPLKGSLNCAGGLPFHTLMSLKEQQLTTCTVFVKVLSINF